MRIDEVLHFLCLSKKEGRDVRSLTKNVVNFLLRTRQNNNKHYAFKILLKYGASQDTQPWLIVLVSNCPILYKKLSSTLAKKLIQINVTGGIGLSSLYFFSLLESINQKTLLKWVIITNELCNEASAYP